MSVSFFVPGIPAPKGSFRIFRNQRTGAPIVAKDSKKTETWHSTVAWVAKNAMQRNYPLKGPLLITLNFYLPRPKSRPDNSWCSVRPDIDKLARATLDPMNGIVYEDDARIVDLRVRKYYAGGIRSGCDIFVSCL